MLGEKGLRKETNALPMNVTVFSLWSLDGNTVYSLSSPIALECSRMGAT